MYAENSEPLNFLCRQIYVPNSVKNKFHIFNLYERTYMSE